MKFQTILFDLDGTLVDSLPLIIECSRLAGAEIGLPWDEEKIRSMIGIPLLETGEALMGKGKGHFYRQVYLNYFHQLHDAQIKIFPGIPEMLAELKATGVKMAVVTSKIHDSALMSLTDTGILSYFDQIITASEPCAHKPSPEPGLLALSRLGAAKEGAVFVGDSPYDMACGQGCAIATCGVTWGMATKEQLSSCHPDYLVDTVAHLQKLLLSSIHNQNREEK